MVAYRRPSRPNVRLTNLLKHITSSWRSRVTTWASRHLHRLLVLMLTEIHSLLRHQLKRRQIKLSLHSRQVHPPTPLHQDTRNRMFILVSLLLLYLILLMYSPVNYQGMPPPPPPPQTKQWGSAPQMDIIPPQLARIAAMSSHENLGRGSSMTPIINRDEAMREWERRNKAGGTVMPGATSGHQKRNSWQQYPQLEYLQEQAERAASQSYMNQARGYAPQQPPPPAPASNLNVVIDPNTNLNMNMGHMNMRQGYYDGYGAPPSATGNGDMGALYVPLVPPQPHQNSMNMYNSQPPTPSSYQSPNTATAPVNTNAYMIPPPQPQVQPPAAPQSNLVRSYSNSNTAYYDPRYPRQGR